MSQLSPDQMDRIRQVLRGNVKPHVMFSQTEGLGLVADLDAAQREVADLRSLIGAIHAEMSGDNPPDWATLLEDMEVRYAGRVPALRIIQSLRRDLA